MLNSTLSGSWSINLAFQQFHMDNAMESCRLLPSQRRDARNLDLTFPIEKVRDISWRRILLLVFLVGYPVIHWTLPTMPWWPVPQFPANPLPLDRGWWERPAPARETRQTQETWMCSPWIFIVHSTMPCFHPARRGRHLSWSQRIRISSKKMMK